MKEELKSSRNKTIDFTEQEGINYINKCLFPSEQVNNLLLNEIENKIICGDSFLVLPKLPKEIKIRLKNEIINLIEKENVTEELKSNNQKRRSGHVPVFFFLLAFFAGLSLSKESPHMLTYVIIY